MSLKQKKLIKKIKLKNNLILTWKCGISAKKEKKIKKEKKKDEIQIIDKEIIRFFFKVKLRKKKNFTDFFIFLFD